MVKLEESNLILSDIIAMLSLFVAYFVQQEIFILVDFYPNCFVAYESNPGQVRTC